MRLVTWNLNHRSHDLQLDSLVDALGAPPPDVFFLQECTGLSVRWGREHAAHQLTPAGNTRLTPAFGSAILAPGQRLEPVSIQTHPGWVVAARVVEGSLLDAVDGPLCLVCVHTPTTPRGKPKVSYTKYLSSIVDELKGLAREATLIVGGDFNLRTIIESPVHEEIVIQPTASERIVLRRFSSDLHLQLAWTAAHGATTPPQTLLWTKDKATPFHCDGIFVPASWRGPISCQVLGGAFLDRSDHLPVVMDYRGAPTRDVAPHHP